MIERIADHALRGLARLAQEFVGKPKLAAFLNLLNAETQDIEDVLWDLMPQNGAGVENGEGAELDRIGRIIGQPRGNSANDDEYRLRLYARMRIRVSSGTIPDIIDVFFALLGDTAHIHEREEPEAGFTLELEDFVMDPTRVEVFADFLRSARVGGTRGIFAWSEVENSQEQRFAVSAFLAGAHLAGATTLTVSSTEELPDSGELVLDDGESSEETVAYSSKTDTTLELDAPTVNDHEGGTAADLVGSVGLGMGDADDEDVGGVLAGARVA